MKYNKSQDGSEESYLAFVEWLTNQTANELRQANGEKEALRAAIAKYLESGNQAQLTPMEL